jgi:hypothetical protein
MSASLAVPSLAVASLANKTCHESMWQVSIETYPAATTINDWRDYSIENNTLVETNFANNEKECTLMANDVIDPHTETAHGDWHIDFKTMFQTNTITQTVRLVRRIIVTHQAEPV